MRFIEWLIFWLVPSVRLQGTPWVDLWRQHDGRLVRQATGATLLIGVAVYGMHIIFDAQAGLEPRQAFIAYRIGMAGLFVGLFFVTRFNKSDHSLVVRLPFLIGGCATSLMQAVSMNWAASIPYFFCILLPILFTLVARMGPAASIVYFSAVWCLEVVVASARLSAEPSFLSLSLVSTAFIMIARSNHGTEIAAFIATRENIRSKMRLIESEKSLSDQIKAFLPREIFARILHLTRKKRMSVVQATDVVLRPEQRRVCCVFSDIRSFTQLTKAGNLTDITPLFSDIKNCTEAVENNHGIPRLIGDLVFGYFDQEDEADRLRSCLRAALDMKAAHQKEDRLPITRFFVLTQGMATVGNIGGYDSSREITAIGEPVNLAARIDAITKHQRIREALGSEQILLSDEIRSEAVALMPTLEIESLDLRALSVEVRDFPEVSRIWVLLDSQHNRDLLFEFRTGIHRFAWMNSDVVEERETA